MAQTTPVLFTPIKVGANQLKHRVVLAPLTRMRASHQTLIPSDMSPEYYAQRSTDGGLLITEATFVSFESGGYDYCPGIYSPEQIAKWKEVTAAVHAKGAKNFVQLWALGRVADPSFVPTVYSAGSIPLVAAGQEASTAPKLHPLTQEDMDRFVQAYHQAALNAIEAGFDGVELHGANGYLIDQFIQSVTNNRTDEYGGSNENRFKFPLRVLNTLCEAIGPERVGVRMSPFSVFQGMREVHPLSTFVPWTQAILAAQPRLAYVHAVEPRIVGNDDVHHADFDQDTLDPIRKIVSDNGTPFIVAGGFTAQNAVDHAEKTGDLVALGRYFIPNPDLPERIKNDWPLHNYDRSTFYSKGAAGYTDYEVYTTA